MNPQIAKNGNELISQQLPLRDTKKSAIKLSSNFAKNVSVAAKPSLCAIKLVIYIEFPCNFK